jgi:phospholipid/cholesterol/gamma-HCH transport system ATP-binding protein
MSASTDITAPVIRFSEVHKSFGEKQILSGFSMELVKGRTLAIMGPSGVGKSVTLKHAIGILTPDAGSVEVFGQEISQTTSKELAEMRKRMGYVFQEGALINWLSVGDNVALPLRENTDLEEDEIRERVQRRLELVHIPDAWELMPSEISGGMKKRVGIARALITDPELILYDEPNAGLDPEIARSINALIRELQESLGVSSLVVEHRIDCIRTVADEVLFLDGGQAVVQAEPEEFFNSSHPRLARFFGKDSA